MRRLAPLVVALALVAIAPAPVAAADILPADADATVTLGGSLGVASVYVGTQSACAILSDESMRCWGTNTYGVLGDNSTTDSHLPVTVTGGHSWKTADVGSQSMCAITTGGELYCWGVNDYGQLGTGVDGWGAGFEEHQPARVGTDSDWIAVTGFNNTFCGLREGGSAWCWGYGGGGEIGNGDTVLRNVPTRVILSDDTNSAGFTAIDAGQSMNCGIAGDGGLWCWGYDQAGALGASPSAGSVVNKASRVGGGTSWKSVAVGYLYACARTAAGAASCFGYNDSYQLGNGTNADAASLTAVSGGHAWSDIGLGVSHTCGIDGTDLYCWGHNGWGEADWSFGDGTIATPRAMATDVAWSDVDSGDYATCGVTEGDVWCWGSNSTLVLGDATNFLSAVARWVIDGTAIPSTTADGDLGLSAALATIAALLAAAGVGLRLRAGRR